MKEYKPAVRPVVVWEGGLCQFATKEEAYKNAALALIHYSWSIDRNWRIEKNLPIKPWDDWFSKHWPEKRIKRLEYWLKCKDRKEGFR